MTGFIFITKQINSKSTLLASKNSGEWTTERSCGHLSRGIWTCFNNEKFIVENAPLVLVQSTIPALLQSAFRCKNQDKKKKILRKWKSRSTIARSYSCRYAGPAMWLINFLIWSQNLMTTTLHLFQLIQPCINVLMCKTSFLSLCDQPILLPWWQSKTELQLIVIRQLQLVNFLTWSQNLMTTALHLFHLIQVCNNVPLMCKTYFLYFVISQFYWHDDNQRLNCN